jgi:hypothetical protein
VIERLDIVGSYNLFEARPKDFAAA